MRPYCQLWFQHATAVVSACNSSGFRGSLGIISCSLFHHLLPVASSFTVRCFIICYPLFHHLLSVVSSFAARCFIIYCSLFHHLLPVVSSNCRDARLVRPRLHPRASTMTSQTHFVCTQNAACLHRKQAAFISSDTHRNALISPHSYARMSLFPNRIGGYRHSTEAAVMADHNGSAGKGDSTTMFFFDTGWTNSTRWLSNDILPSGLERCAPYFKSPRMGLPALES